MARASETPDAAHEQPSEQIRRVVADCLRRRSAGEEVSDESIVAAHPELMPELAAELRKLRAVAAAREKTEQRASDHPDRHPTERRGLHIRCPHCHNPVELVADTPFTDITCSSCGSHFSLVGNDGKTYTRATVETIGHFETIEHLGTGGFGTVWKARDTELDRTVAFKVPRQGQLTAVETEQFLREARAAAQLHHPNIVTVHEVGRDGDNVYIVSDFVRGIPLSDWLTGQQVTAREAAELCAKIADGLHHAHEAGVIHRDLKPSNILIDAAMEPHIMDFCLAKREAGEITMTLEGQVLGTPAYMSPEQAQGEAHQSDRRTDIYSLGVALFELLTGELPFRGNPRMLQHQVINDEPPSPRKLNSSVPRDMETICLKCLEKDPDRRYATAQNVADELRRYLAGEAIRASPISAPARTWRWCKRNPMGAAVTGLVLCFAIAGLFVSIREASFRRDAEAKEKAAREAAANEAKAREEIRRLLYISDMNGALQAWEDADIARVADLLHRHRPEPGQEDLRGFEWHYLWRLSHSDRLTMRGHAGNVRSVAFSPDGKTLASASDDMTVILWDVTTGRERLTLKEHTSPLYDLAFTDDGTTLGTLGGDGKLTVWDASTGRKRFTFMGQGPDDEELASLGTIAFSPSGELLAAAPGCDTVTVWDLGKRQPQYRLEGHTDPVCAVAFAPDGKTIASATWNWRKPTEVKLWDAASGALQFTLTGHVAAVYCLTFDPLGRTLGTGNYDKTVTLWDLNTQRVRTTFQGHTLAVRAVEFAPDGQTFASGSLDGTARLWDVVTGDELTTLTGHSAPVTSVAFAPDGKTLATASSDMTVRLWELTTDVRWASLKGHTAEVRCVAFRPDGKMLLTGGFDDTAKLWNLASGTEQATLEGHAGLIEAAVFSPDGTRAATASRDGTVKLWDTAAAQERGVLRGHRGPVLALGFSPQGTLLATGGEDQTVRIWDVATQRQRRTLKGHTEFVQCLAFSSDGNSLATGSWDKTARLWDVATGAELGTFTGHSSWVNSVAFSPDGKMLATGSWDTTARLWDLATRQVRVTLRGHTGGIFALAFSPDGKRAATGGWDGAVKLWDPVSGQLLASYQADPQRVWPLAFSPDGDTLAVAGWGSTVKLYRAATDDEVDSHPDAARLLYTRAKSLRSNDNLDQAEPLYREALRLHRQILGEDHVWTAQVMLELGSLLAQQKDRAAHTAAEELLSGALAVFERKLASPHPWRREARQALQTLYDSETADRPAKLVNAESKLAEEASSE